MYRIDPPAVYAHESTMAEPRFRERVERVCAALERPQTPVVYTDEQLPELIESGNWKAGLGAMGTKPEVRDPILVFNTFRFDDDLAEAGKRFDEAKTGIGGHVREMLLGSGAFVWFPAGLKEDPRRKAKVCRACWRIHFQAGCLHRCAYCGLGGILATMVNVEEYLVHLDRLIERHPWQLTYLLEDDADIPCLEPELGCLGPIIEHFGTLDNRYLVIHTKTWNVDWMLPLKHSGNTIMVWSISTPGQSRLLEPKTGTCEERVEAARKCQEAGYVVRYKYKPIIPVRNWREEASQAIEMMMTQTKPDVISLCAFMWMDYAEMVRRLGADNLDPEMLAIAEASADELKGVITGPFPEAARATIYDHYIKEIRTYDKEVPISLSTESWEMWERFRKRLGASGSNYTCGCGPQAAPGLRKLPQSAWRGVVRNDEGLKGTNMRL
jgi:DNA repair photolyase